MKHLPNFQSLSSIVVVSSMRRYTALDFLIICIYFFVWLLPQCSHRLSKLRALFLCPFLHLLHGILTASSIRFECLQHCRCLFEVLICSQWRLVCQNLHQYIHHCHCLLSMSSYPKQHIHHQISGVVVVGTHPRCLDHVGKWLL